jgi:hypothetical protein
MGLLDDAIRDHLELKRRHGADPSEVADQEREALGPVRRDAPEPSGADAGAVSATAEGAEDDYEPLPGDDVAETTDEEEPLYDDDLLEDDEFEDEEPAAGRATAAAAAGSEPAEAGTDTESEGDDVLEETPEFLQETPEHDRLWFEQKPPRDFDF